MTKNVATVADIVNNLSKSTQAKSVITVLTDKPYWAVYDKNYKAIDALLRNKYSCFVIPEVSAPSEVGYPITPDIIFDELTAVSNEMLIALTSSLDRLWELESVTFNPIENYDRYENLENTRTGTETDTTTQTGSEKNVSTPSGSDVTTTKLTGIVKETNGGQRVNSQDNVNTSYNTNEVTKVTDTVADNTTHETDYNNATTEVNYLAGVVNTNVRTYENVVTEGVKEYANVKDIAVNHIHGNIGVTTATAMMVEFVSFYDTYNFWSKFWDMFITLFASPIFETGREYYERAE